MLIVAMLADSSDALGNRIDGAVLVDAELFTQEGFELAIDSSVVGSVELLADFPLEVSGDRLGEVLDAHVCEYRSRERMSSDFLILRRLDDRVEACDHQ